MAVVNAVLDEVDVLSEHTRTFLGALTDLKKGNASAQLPQDWTGVFGKVADAFNDVVAENLRMSHELARLSQVVGKEGKLKERAYVPNVSGFWRDSAESINSLIDDLVHPTSEVARVIGAVAQGDLSKTHGAGSRRPAAGGRVPAHRHDHQHDGASSSAPSPPK